jgi:PAS domain S-box-containing protein
MPLTREKPITSLLVFGYRLALSLLAVLSLISFLILEENIRSEKSSAAVVNYSGRQRMLSQRIALFSMRLVSEKDIFGQDNLREEIKSSIELMEKTHQGLIKGEPSMNLPPRQSREAGALYFLKPVSLDEQVRAYIGHARSLVSASVGTTLTLEDPHLGYILDASGERFIKSLDGAVAQYQKESEARMLRLEALQFLVLVIALFIICATGIFIFHPLAGRIRLKAQQLEKQAADLSASNERLQKAMGERLELDGKLIAANELNDTLLKTIPFGIDIVDEEGTILYLNEKMINLFGREALGEKCYHLYKDNKQQCESCPLENGVQLGQTRRTEVSGAMGGRIFLISHTGMLYQNKKAILEIFEDITDYKNTQEKLALSERLASIGRMAGVIAHEFRNQLAVMRNVVYFLKMKLKDKDEKVTKHLLILDELVSDTERIIENILTFARKKQPELEKIDLKNLLLESIDKVKIPEGIALTTQIGQLPLLDGDPLQLGGVFVNIILNAIQAMGEKGKVQVRVIKEGNYVNITFHDTGKGMKEEDKIRLFEPFFSTKPRGTGLGLATAKIIVEAHGGSINIKSDYGEGAAVIVSLPMKTTA